MWARSRRWLPLSFGTVASCLCLAPASAGALASSTPDQGAFVTNGAVRAIKPAGDVTYIGGDFTELRAHTGPFASLSSISGLRNPSSAEVAPVSGSVRVTLPDGEGGVYIGGDFSSVRGVARPNLAHILPDGSVDMAFNASPDAGVSALALSGAALYAGGSFTNIGGATRNRIAKLSAASGNAVSTWDANAQPAGSSVRAIAVDGSVVYVGGSFTDVGGLARHNIAKLSATSGNAFSAWEADTDNQVSDIAVVDGMVFAGGIFNNIKGVAKPRLAKLSGSTGGVFTTFNANATGAQVNAVESSGSELFVGGTFATMGGLPRTNVAKLSTTTGNAFSAWKPGVFCSACGSQGVFALAVLGDTVFIGGRFVETSNSDGSAVFTRSNMAKISADSGNIFSGWAANTGASTGGPDVFAVSAFGTRVFAGGDFDFVNRMTRNRIAALNANGIPTAWNPDADNSVRDIEVSEDGGEVYPVGDFSMIGGRPRSKIAKLSAASGNAFDGFDPDPSGTRIRTIERDGSALYAGGEFTQGGDDTGNDNLAKYSAETGNVFTGFAPNSNGNVAGLTVADGAVYAGGSFTEIGRLPRARIAKLSATTGNAFSAWNPGAAAPGVGALELSGAALYVGGDFNGANSIGGQSRDYIAKLSALSGNVSTAFNAAANQPVISLAMSGSELYAGGLFTTMNGVPRTGLAAISTDPNTAGGVFDGFDADLDDSVIAVAGTPSKVYAGGFFTEVGGRPRQGYAQFSQP